MSKGLKDVTVIPVKRRKKVVTSPEQFHGTIHFLIENGFPSRKIKEVFVRKAS